jgi:predicted DNA-binding protein
MLLGGIMTTTQIELTDSQVGILRTFAQKTGKTEDQLVSEVISKFINDIGSNELSEAKRRQAIKAAAGIWKDRDDLTDEFFEKLRKESNRNTDWSNRNG